MDDEIPLKKKRRRGRPRNADENGNQASDIVDVAVELFRRQGYQATTMSQIAEAAGYGQSAVYYWYRRKEEILEEIYEETEVSLDVALQISALPDDKITQLYSVLYSDTYMLCDAPFDYYDLESVAHSQDDYLQGFFDTYRSLFNYIEQIIRDGIGSGEFVKVNPTRATASALALTEALQHRYHVCQRYPKSFSKMIGNDNTHVFESPKELAHLAASTALLSLSPGCATDEIRDRAILNGWIGNDHPEISGT